MLKKIMQYLLVAIATFAFTVPVAAAQQETKPAVVKVKKAKKATPTKAVAVPALGQAAIDAFVFEALWRSGAPEYQAVVEGLASLYAAEMDNNCQVTSGSFDVAVSAYAKAYGVYAPPGSEAVRDRFMKKQVATLACVTMHNDGALRAAKLHM